MSSNNKLLPQLDSEEGVAQFLVDIEAFCLVEGFHLVMDLNLFNASRPVLPINPNQAQRTSLQEWEAIDRKFYGYLIIALKQVTFLRDKLTKRAAVIANPYRGSVLMNEFKNYFFANPNAQIYENIQTKIRSYKQKSKEVDVAISELNHLNASLPAAYANTDQQKILQLRSSLSIKYADAVKTLTMSNPQLTYSDICDLLIREATAEALIASSSAQGETEEAHIAEQVDKDKVDNMTEQERSYRGHSQHYSRSSRSRSPRQENRGRSSERRSGHLGRYGGGNRGKDSRDRGHYSNERYSYDHRRSRSRSRSGGRRGASYSRSRSRSPGRPHDRRARSPTPHPRDSRNVQWKDLSRIQCFTCQKYGHKANDCRQR